MSRPCAVKPFAVRGKKFGGAQPLFCVPMVAADIMQLAEQARTAESLTPDVIEWRADSYTDISAESLQQDARELRAIVGPDIPIIFTLRIQCEGGAHEIPQEQRIAAFGGILLSQSIDLVDVELCNGPQFVEEVVTTAHDNGVRVILSFHNFEATPANDVLLQTIGSMIGSGADVAKIAVMPHQPADVLRLFEVTLEARKLYPAAILSTMSMGRLGSISRVAGFLYGSDMAYAAGPAFSAPGQIPLADARMIAESLLRYA